MALKKFYVTLIISDVNVLSLSYPVTALMVTGAGEIAVKSRTSLHQSKGYCIIPQYKNN